MSGDLSFGSKMLNAQVVGIQAKLVDSLVELDSTNKNQQKIDGIDQLARALFLGRQLVKVEQTAGAESSGRIDSTSKHKSSGNDCRSAQTANAIIDKLRSQLGLENSDLAADLSTNANLEDVRLEDVRLEVIVISGDAGKGKSPSPSPSPSPSQAFTQAVEEASPNYLQNAQVVENLNQALVLAAKLIAQDKLVILVSLSDTLSGAYEDHIYPGKAQDSEQLNNKVTGAIALALSSENLALTQQWHSFAELSLNTELSLNMAASLSSELSKAALDKNSADSLPNFISKHIAEQVASTHQALAINCNQVHVLGQSQLFSRNSFAKQSDAELNGLAEIFTLATTASSKTTEMATAKAANEVTRTTAACSVNQLLCADVGFSQLLGLVQSVLSLTQNYIPSLNLSWLNCSSQKSPDQTQPIWASQTWQNSGLYFAESARPWFFDQQATAPRFSAYSSLCFEGLCFEDVCTEDEYTEDLRKKENAQSVSYSYVVLGESKAQIQRKKELQRKTELQRETEPSLANSLANGFFANSEYKLFVIAGQDQSTLIQALDKFEHNLNASLVNGQGLGPSSNACQQQRLAELSKNSCQQFAQTNDNDRQFHVALLASSFEELATEITLAKTGIVAAFATKNNAAELKTDNRKAAEWKTPRGSYFSAEPAGNDNSGISFLYPGIGATYIGLGQSLFQLFPEVLPLMNKIAPRLSHSLKDKWLNPRAAEPLSFDQLQTLDKSLRASLPDIAEAGVAYACLFTQIFQQVFKLNADYAAGYSMGEVSMFAALGCWQDPSAMSERLANSDTFNRQICGELLALNEAWGIAHDAEKPQWQTYTIKAKIEDVEPLLADEPRVYCTIINTPNNLVIAGEPESCQRVFKKLKVRAMPLYMANAIHSPPAHSQYQQMLALYQLPMAEKVTTKIYSSSCYLPVPQLGKAIAVSIAKCLCDRVDFPRLINTMHNDGARIFIELGPSRSLTSWVEKILQGKPHTAVSINAKGSPDELIILKALAKLISHGAKPDLSALFNRSMFEQQKQQSPNALANENHHLASLARSV